MKTNIHTEKYHLQDVSGIENEQKRLQGEYKNYVNPDETSHNLVIDHVTGKEYNGSGEKNWHKQIKEQKERQIEETGRKIRKDIVVLASTVASVPSSWGEDAAKDFFREWDAKYQEFLKTWGVPESAFLSTAIHCDEGLSSLDEDEATNLGISADSQEHHYHATFAFMPIKDGKFNGKGLISKEFLRQEQSFQKELLNSYCDRHPNLERLESYTAGNGGKRLSEAAYKQKQEIIRLEAEKKKLEKEVAILDAGKNEETKFTEKKSPLSKEVTVPLEQAKAVDDARRKAIVEKEQLQLELERTKNERDSEQAKYKVAREQANAESAKLKDTENENIRLKREVEEQQNSIVSLNTLLGELRERFEKLIEETIVRPFINLFNKENPVEGMNVRGVKPKVVATVKVQQIVDEVMEYCGNVDRVMEYCGKEKDVKDIAFEQLTTEGKFAGTSYDKHLQTAESKDIVRRDLGEESPAEKYLTNRDIANDRGEEREGW